LNTNQVKTLASRIIPPVFLAVVVIAFFPTVASMTHIPAAKDTITFSYPYQAELSRSLRAGDFPLWSKSANFPVFAESQGAYAHPLHLLLIAVFPPWVASNLFLLIHVYLALLFTYLFCRETGLGRAAATLAALTFGLSGFFLARLGIYTIITNGVWLPGLLWFAARYARTGRPREMLLFTGGAALAVLAGQFQLAVYSVLTASAYLLYVNRKKWRSTLLVLGGVAVVLVGLTAVQTLPTLELLLNSHRASAERAGDYSLWPPQLLQLLVPDLFGRAPHPPYAPTDNAPLDTYWGRGSYVESAFYVGVVPLVLAFAAAIKRREPFWIIVTAVSAVVAFGAYTPLFKLYETVPPFNLFRGPSRFLFMATMGLAVLAGRGLDDFRRKPTRLYLWTGLVVLLAAVGTVSALRLSLPFVEKFAYGKAETKAAEMAAEGYDESESLTAYRVKAEEMTSRAVAAADPLRGPYLVQLTFLVGTALLLWTGYKKKPSAEVLVPALLVLLTAADLHYYNRDLNPTTPVRNVREPPTTAELVIDDEPGRTFSTGFELADDTRLGLGLIHENTHLIWGLDCTVPRTSLREKNQLAYFVALEEVYTKELDALAGRRVKTTPTTLAPFSALNVRYFIRRAPLDTTGVRLLGEAGPYKVYANGGATPRAYLLGNAHVEEDTDKAIEYIFSGEFDPAFDVVLERPVDFDRGSISYPIEAEIVEYSNNEAIIEYESPAPAVLYFSDLYYPGWRAELDGEEVEILRANVVGRAVEAPAGRHVVKFYYLPLSFTAGFIVTCAFLIAYAGLFVAENLLYGRKKKAI
jgi:hypothetical protein